MCNLNKPPITTFIVLATLLIIALIIGIVIGKTTLDEGNRFTWSPHSGKECAVIKFDNDSAMDCYNVEKTK